MAISVGIVGAGPAGLTLALLLERVGLEVTVLEVRTREYVEHRVRAGLLEQNTVDLLRELGVAGRLDREGLLHDGIWLRFGGENHHIDIAALTGRRMTIYGQQEIVKDEIAALLDRGVAVEFGVTEVELHDLEDAPRILFRTSDGPQELHCDFVAGCDGSHGVSRRAVPAGRLRAMNRSYPFSWLGVLAEAEPAYRENVYAWHERGFALHSSRSSRISRLYLQVPRAATVAEWPAERIWSELRLRLGVVNEGPLIDLAITPLRSLVLEPMRYGRLFLAGDAAHIVPPTGAKGLNLAVNDVRLLAAALVEFAGSGTAAALDAYSRAALGRVWRAQEFSHFLTTLLHVHGADPFERRMQVSRLEYLTSSRAAEVSLAENYAGLPARAAF